MILALGARGPEFDSRNAPFISTFYFPRLYRLWQMGRVVLSITLCSDPIFFSYINCCPLSYPFSSTLPFFPNFLHSSLSQAKKKWRHLSQLSPYVLHHLILHYLLHFQRNHPNKPCNSRSETLKSHIEPPSFAPSPPWRLRRRLKSSEKISPNCH